MFEKKQKNIKGTLCALSDAYERTKYVIEQPSFTLVCNRLNSSWNEFCHRHGINSYALITPYNPRSIKLSPQKNHWRLKEFESRVRVDTRNYYYYSALDPEGIWENEKGIVLLNMPLEYVRRYALSYDQNAFAQAKIDESLKLFWMISSEPFL